MEDIITRTEIIDSDKAKKMLEHMITNRSLETLRVAQYRRDMMAGAWQHNGESIKINSAGELIDGQHRLNAIAGTNLKVKMTVMYNVDATICDKSKQRSTSDILKMNGYEKGLANSFITGVIKFHYSTKFNQTLVSDESVMAFVDRNSRELAIVNDIARSSGNQFVKKVSTRKSPIGLAMFYAVVLGIDLNKLRRFSEVVSSGYANGSFESAAITLRNDLLNKNFAGRSGRLDMLYRSEKAILDFSRGVERKKTYSVQTSPTFSNKSILKNL